MRDTILSFLAFAKNGAALLGLTGLVTAIDAVLGSPMLLDLFISIAERFLSGAPMPMDASAFAADERAAFQAASIDIGQIIALIQLLSDIWSKLKK